MTKDEEKWFNLTLENAHSQNYIKQPNKKGFIT